MGVSRRGGVPPQMAPEGLRRDTRVPRGEAPSGELSVASTEVSPSGLQQKTEVSRGGRDATGASAGNAEAPRGDSGAEVGLEGRC